MEPERHVKTVRSVSSPAGVPPSVSFNSSEHVRAAMSRAGQTLDPNQSHSSKECRRRHTSLLLPSSSSYVSDMSFSALSTGSPAPEEIGLKYPHNEKFSDGLSSMQGVVEDDLKLIKNEVKKKKTKISNKWNWEHNWVTIPQVHAFSNAATICG